MRQEQELQVASSYCTVLCLAYALSGTDLAYAGGILLLYCATRVLCAMRY